MQRFLLVFHDHKSLSLRALFSNLRFFEILIIVLLMIASFNWQFLYFLIFCPFYYFFVIAIHDPVCIMIKGVETVTLLKFVWFACLWVWVYVLSFYPNDLRENLKLKAWRLLFTNHRETGGLPILSWNNDWQ